MLVVQIIMMICTIALGVGVFFFFGAMVSAKSDVLSIIIASYVLGILTDMSVKQGYHGFSINIFIHTQLLAVIIAAVVFR